MTFPAYSEYKPSGFDWLPEVPAHWVDRKIARDIPFVVGWTPPSGKDEYYDGDLPWVTIADMTQVSVEDTKSKISHLAVQDKGAKVVPAGSMLFSFKLSVGKIAFLTIDSYTNEAIAGFLPSGPLDLEYWKYAAPEFIPRYGRENIYGATLLNQELISSVRFFAPARAEQTQIARFLDHETARIDALIAEQQRLIELLKEKRQAVISHAVTKGLDPTVPMKDSGVEWLGEVPAHWDVIRSKFVYKLVSGYAFKSEFFQKDGEGEKVLITPGSFDEVGRLYFSEKNTVQYGGEWQAQFELKDGDLVMVLTDLSYKKLILGRAAFVGRDDALLNQRIAKVIVTSRVKANYLWLAINSEVMREQVKLTASGATVFHTSSEKVGDCWMTMPPCEEQLQIAAFAEEFHLELDSLIEQVREAVGLLGERRSALISAAVTGKIDVRGWQPPTSTQAAETAVAEAV
ncbi:restriction endonuclease subunit S [Stutzerimonas stutzeri]|uniref:restriction endonuclease subunit S n=1 Tax=Stutzerimonas stutzeri TaxID=316 RepID=UPI0022031EDB|nr:restriction endonuclease subunit S [Stutzerimonas stutzeri]UVO17493.1 restriction endonuclease subunit S [Stutzerimonas stutzeri]